MSTGVCMEYFIPEVLKERVPVISKALNIAGPSVVCDLMIICII